MRGSHVSTLIVGGGTAGCVLANRLSADPDHQVALVEAGPDFGPADSGRWPEAIALTPSPRSWPMLGHHDWGYQAEVAGRRLPYFAGKVMGGSSATNMNGIAMGLRRDYQRWVALGNPGWSFDDLLPYFQRVERLENDDVPLRGREGQVPVQRFGLDGPLLDDLRAAAVDAGVPAIADVTGPDAVVGIGGATRNVRGRRRFSSASAYLDPARGRANLTIVADALVESLTWRGGRAIGALVRAGDTTTQLTADRVIVSAGVLGSPLLLQRSGIGDPALLRPILGESAPIHALPGVGKNLHDHYGATIHHQMSADGADRLYADEPPEGLTAFTAFLRVASDPSLDAHDHDIIVGFPPFRIPVRELQQIRWRVFLVQPESEGSIAISGREATAPPRIETGFGGERDLAAIARAVGWVRRLAGHPRLAGWIESEIVPGPSIGPDALPGWLRDHLDCYYHPTGTCRMGPATDPMAVADASGRVHGFDNLFVADASLMPTIPRGMINLTVYAMAEKIADGLAHAT
jgi:choline dehydrogenase